MPIYLVRSGTAGDVKIGLAVDVLKRVRGLQTSHPVKLRIIRVLDGVGHHERMLHKKFASSRLSGEWFKFCPEMITGDLGLADLPIPIPKRGYNDQSTAWGRRRATHQEIGCIINTDELARRMGIPPWEACDCLGVLKGHVYSAAILMVRDAGFTHWSVVDLLALDTDVAKAEVDGSVERIAKDRKKREIYDEKQWRLKNKGKPIWWKSVLPDPKNPDVDGAAVESLAA